MNRYYLRILIVAIFTGCISNNQTNRELNDSTTDTSVNAEEIDSNKPLPTNPEKFYPKADTLIRDTILIDSFRIIIQPVKKENYIKICETSGLKDYPSSSTSKIAENFNEKAWRLNDSIILIKLSSGLIDTVTNYYSTDGLGFAKYTYIDYLKEINSHLIAGKHYESDNYVLVDNSTGEMDKQTLSSNLSIDSTRQRLITYAWDGFAFQSGGFTIFDISQGNLVKLLTYYQRNPEQDGFFWSLSDVYYLSPNELIYIHQIYLSKNHRIMQTYSKMSIEKITTDLHLEYD